MTPHSSAVHSTGALRHMGLMKETRAGSGFRQRSRMVPVKEFEPPAAAAAAPPREAGGGGAVPPGAATRALRVRPIGRGGLGERAHTDLLAAVPLVYGFPEQQELLGGEARHERPEGVHSSHMDLSHPPERPPGGIVAKQRSGRALGQILCLAGKSIAFGDLPVPGTVKILSQIDLAVSGPVLF